jgi:hypothetical protein
MSVTIVPSSPSHAYAVIMAYACMLPELERRKVQAAALMLRPQAAFEGTGDTE